MSVSIQHNISQLHESKATGMDIKYKVLIISGNEKTAKIIVTRMGAVDTVNGTKNMLLFYYSFVQRFVR